MRFFVKSNTGDRGAALMLVLVFLIAFIIVLGALIKLISLQSHVTSDQTQENRSFGLADAGVRYAQWLVSDEGGKKTPQELRDSPPPEATRHEVAGDDGSVLGYFMLEFLEVPADEQDTLSFRSIGFSADRSESCQAVKGELKPGAEGVYQVVEWDHLRSFPCRDYTIGGVPVRSLTLAAGSEVMASGNLGPDKADRYIIDMPATPVSIKAVSSVFPVKIKVDKHVSNPVAWVINRAAAQVAAKFAPEESSQCDGMASGTACLPSNGMKKPWNAGERYVIEVRVKDGAACVSDCGYELMLEAGM